MGFINKFIELAKADGKTVAVVGNDFYVNQVKDNGDQASADVVLEVAVPAQTTVELCATAVSYTHLDVYKRQEFIFTN